MHKPGMERVFELCIDKRLATVDINVEVMQLFEGDHSRLQFGRREPHNRIPKDKDFFFRIHLCLRGKESK